MNMMLHLTKSQQVSPKLCDVTKNNVKPEYPTIVAPEIDTIRNTRSVTYSDYGKSNSDCKSFADITN